MVRIGEFLKTQNYVRSQGARRRFISPYQVGGTIFSKSMQSRYPLLNTSSSLQDILPRGVKPWMARRPLWKGIKRGSIFGKSTQLRYPGMTSQWPRGPAACNPGWPVVVQNL